MSPCPADSQTRPTDPARTPPPAHTPPREQLGSLTELSLLPFAVFSCAGRGSEIVFLAVSTICNREDLKQPKFHEQGSGQMSPNTGALRSGVSRGHLRLQPFPILELEHRTERGHHHPRKEVGDSGFPTGPTASALSHPALFPAAAHVKMMVSIHFQNLRGLPNTLRIKPTEPSTPAHPLPALTEKHPHTSWIQLFRSPQARHARRAQLSVSGTRSGPTPAAFRA